ncbi:MAG: Coq4 family protein [Parvibaculaceae bacterium]|nr:Coq4 family protein [Parvibaculaceae bacterium]
MGIAFDQDQQDFQAKVEGGDFMAGTAAIEAVTRAARQGDAGAIAELCALFARVAFITPEAASAVYDAFTRAWLASDDPALRSTMESQAALAHLTGLSRLSPALWADFWSIVQGAGTPDAEGLTAQVAGLGAHMDEAFTRKAEAVAARHPGCAGAASRPAPRRLTLDELARQPQGSLGHDIHTLIVSNDFDLEVLDREAIGLAQMTPALRYLNTRILQTHDIWHLVGGYRTTVLHEVGISAFQLAQFGHNYSAMLLAVAASSIAHASPEGFPVFIQVMAEAWLHGRRTPSFMNIDWESEWRDSIATIRARHNILPFESLYPADLIEQFASAA